jgi:hypothetical protein
MIRAVPAILVTWLLVSCTAPLPQEDTTSADGDSSEETRSEPVSLIDNWLWIQVSGDNDPFDHTRRAETTVCPEAELNVEQLPDGDWFDVITKNCAYVTVTQPLLADIPTGGTLKIRIWHFAITMGNGPFTLAIQIGKESEPLWTITKPFPSDSGLIFDEFTTQNDYTKGTPIYYHISNHGNNSWGLIEFSYNP